VDLNRNAFQIVQSFTEDKKKIPRVPPLRGARVGLAALQGRKY
jgi:hypothetical protein